MSPKPTVLRAVSKDRPQTENAPAGQCPGFYRKEGALPPGPESFAWPFP